MENLDASQGRSKQVLEQWYYPKFRFERDFTESGHYLVRGMVFNKGDQYIRVDV